MPKFKPCSRCGETFQLRRGTHLRCDPCRIAHKTDPETLVKLRANRIAQRAVATGRLVRQPCERCGRSPTHAHHDDYTKPLEVRWLCPLDHKWEHDPVMRAIRVDRLTGPRPDRDW